MLAYLYLIRPGNGYLLMHEKPGTDGMFPLNFLLSECTEGREKAVPFPRVPDTVDGRAAPV